jgi:response regulator of citrate/malate metabolism
VFSFSDIWRRTSKVEDKEHVIEITQRGKNALSTGLISGVEADILEQMKTGYPYTLDTLSEAICVKRTLVRTAANRLLDNKYIEVVN